ncbi:3-hydroxy-3-methylglutaryl-coenzyme A reductase isoform X2 [Harpegnathos saltator]|uniref:3-hydroxy-3-methylglutaryl coenzyme A reductase n=2 Tax=Harpegnathos saltator TaxID=610380 RepID=E2B617_HARSA|nr:3-hydroxy-3-methylglutaryl-coenzyme A reductase isoform X2 [Harpegnathos saltator]XP_025156308.1 3-hydroxy-3-methylglutaryl-coenzyme A reductase isoform X2 [Harpegnathos saltator]XP_025156309.1 3-hydroxy-3-methylglutaryl-coenzyme A reductase isoform X2 [Harpegnathos saltator]EFN88878.1 3-hydroxy-3-methylglutaryl-coenzyme A reductase [Harpegnathos saltator]
MARFFEIYGRFCAGHPVEVIVATFTLTACIFNMETGNSLLREGSLLNLTRCRHGKCDSDEQKAVDIILRTIICCFNILFTYYLFRNLQKIGPKYVLGIASVFTIFSSVMFTSTLVNYDRANTSDLKHVLFFFLLLIDFSKACTLAKYALSSRSQEEVRTNIARGMSLLGPSITLDTIVEFLLIGIGSLSGVSRLEVICTFACLGVIVNYIVFMTFYPACLSLILELYRRNNSMGQLSVDKRFIMQLLNEENQKTNPVVQRVKTIMIFGLFMVHTSSRWPFKTEEPEHTAEAVATSVRAEVTNGSYKTENSELTGHLLNMQTVKPEHFVIIILALALSVKFIFLDRNDEETETEEIEAEIDDLASDDTNTIGMDMSLRRRFREKALQSTQQPSIFPLSGIGGGWIENDNERNVEYSDKEVQTETNFDKYFGAYDLASESSSSKIPEVPRSVKKCLEIYKSELGANALTDEEVIELVKHKHIAAYQLEKAVGDMERGVGIRRLMIGAVGNFTEEIADLPYKNYDYSKVLGSCCENVIGYLPVPVGIAGPLLIDGELYHVPMATTEGCLVASTNRGSRALMKCGVTSRIVADGMTRGPVVRFPSIVRASEAMSWMQQEQNFQEMKDNFDQTSRFARLTRIHVRIAGRHLFVRFVAKTGDAMGMNMLSKGTEKSLQTVQSHFPDMEILSLSGNFCTDKKPAAVNWIEGRGKSVVCEAVVPADVVTSVLKTSVHALVDVNISKNMVGSAVAGSIGGFNAHAANIVTAIFIATGQDPAQNVGSSNCMTLMEPWGEEGQDLYVSCTMPSIEIGTVGGGTGLPAQAACLAMLGVKGAHATEPGENASKLARIVCATVLAGELSLMAALTAGHLVKSHLRHNRSSIAVSNSMNIKHSNAADDKLTASSQYLCADFPQEH